jgi:sulfoxide reductase catalytic subunit YedY
MLIRIAPALRVRPSEMTAEALWQDRRAFLVNAAAALAATALSARSAPLAAACTAMKTPGLAEGERANTYSEITSYNNFYEYSTDKAAVAHIAREAPERPWALTIDGEVQKPLTLDLDELLHVDTIESRVYRLRCVEGWSMIIPWDGFSLCKLIARAQPTSRAKYVTFVGPYDPSRYIGQRRGALEWPYTEALTIAEAMHPLTMLVTGVYGKPLPAQNGAPLRLAVPWKYGFKSIKAIATIRLQAERPQTTWMKASPSEYGFYGNVNPEVAHPRWTQAREVRIGELKARPTLPFNGYADQVAALYAGLDLRANY